MINWGKLKFVIRETPVFGGPVYTHVNNFEKPQSLTTSKTAGAIAHAFPFDSRVQPKIVGEYVFSYLLIILKIRQI